MRSFCAKLFSASRARQISLKAQVLHIVRVMGSSSGYVISAPVLPARAANVDVLMAWRSVLIVQNAMDLGGPMGRLQTEQIACLRSSFSFISSGPVLPKRSVSVSSISFLLVLILRSVCLLGLKGVRSRDLASGPTFVCSAHMLVLRALVVLAWGYHRTIVILFSSGELLEWYTAKPTEVGPIPDVACQFSIRPMFVYVAIAS